MTEDPVEALQAIAAAFSADAVASVLDTNFDLWTYRLTATLDRPPVWFTDREARNALTARANDLIDEMDRAGWQLANQPIVILSADIDFAPGAANIRTWTCRTTLDAFAPGVT